MNSNPIPKELAKASLAAIVIGVGLCWIGWKAYLNGNLLQSYVLIFTSNIVTLIYLFGTRKYYKQMGVKKDDSKDVR